MGCETDSDGPEPRGTCIFCGCTDLSDTHILPGWLDTMFPDAPADVGGTERAVLSARAPIVCAGCNNGWTHTLDEHVRGFLMPALQGRQVDLSAAQARSLSGWLCLIATKAAFLTRNCGISRGARSYLRQTGEPPRNWSIFAAGLSENGWSRACQHHPSRIEFSGHPLTRHSRGQGLKDCNTQLLAMGLGPLFFQMFSSPSLVLMNDFASASRAQGLARIWPVPRRFGLIPVQHVMVPPALSLSDAQAATVAAGFAGRLRDRLRPGVRV